MPKEGLEAEAAGTIQHKTSAIARDGAVEKEPDRDAKCAIDRTGQNPLGETLAPSWGDRDPVRGAELSVDVNQLLALCRAVEALLTAGSIDLARIALAQLRGLLEVASGPAGEVIGIPVGWRPP